MCRPDIFKKRKGRLGASKRQDVTLETLTLFEINPHFSAVTYHADYQTFAETRFPCGGGPAINNQYNTEMQSA